MKMNRFVTRFAAAGALVVAASLDPSAALARGTPVTDAVPCVPCGSLLALDCNFGLWRIEPATATATFVGMTPEFMFDLALTGDGRLFSIDSSGNLWQLDPCTAQGAVVASGYAGNGMDAIPAAAPGSAGSPAAPAPPGSASSPSSGVAAEALYLQGPPLVRVDPAPPYPPTVLGGQVGPMAPDWCNVSSGDLAYLGAEGVFYSSVVSVQLAPGLTPACPTCPGSGDILLQLDPATGQSLGTVGCLVDPAGSGLAAIQGLAFDPLGQLWGVRAEPNTGLYRIDRQTAVGVLTPVIGGFHCGVGLAAPPGCP